MIQCNAPLSSKRKFVPNARAFIGEACILGNVRVIVSE